MELARPRQYLIYVNLVCYGLIYKFLDMQSAGCFYDWTIKTSLKSRISQHSLHPAESRLKEEEGTAHNLRFEIGQFGTTNTDLRVFRQTTRSLETLDNGHHLPLFSATPTRILHATSNAIVELLRRSAATWATSSTRPSSSTTAAGPLEQVTLARTPRDASFPHMSAVPNTHAS